MDEPNPQIRERFEATRKVGRASMAYGNKSLAYSVYSSGYSGYPGYITSGYSGYGVSGYSLYPNAWSGENITFRQSAFVNQGDYEVSEESSFPIPFTQANLLSYEENQIQELIFRIRTFPSISCKELANRLLALFNYAKEEGASIAINSFRDFYSFLRLNPHLQCPTISLTPEYNIYVSWKADQNRVFSLHFLSNGDVRYVIFKPNERHPERQIRVSGSATIDILQETVASYGVWDWISVSETATIEIFQETVASHGVWSWVSE